MLWTVVKYAIICTLPTEPRRMGRTDGPRKITPGRRADLVRVHRSPHHPVVRGVWREGGRVA